MHLIALVVSLLLNIFQYKKRDNYSGRGSRGHKAKSAQHLAVSSDAINIKWHPDEHERQRRKDRFRWSKDGPAWMGTGFAFLAFIISVLAYREAARQADITQEQLENTDRPWIELASIERPRIDFTGPGMPFSFGIPKEKIYVHFNGTPVIKNIGKSTAINIRTVLFIVIHKWGNGWGDFAKDQERACAAAKASDFGTTIFPDGARNDVGNGSGDIIDASNTSISNGLEYVAPAIVGCIEYQFATSGRHHQTAFVFEAFTESRTRVFVIGKNTGLFLIRDEQYDLAD